MRNYIIAVLTLVALAATWAGGKNWAKELDSKDAEKRGESQAERGFLFEDPYWDEVFCSYYDPTLGTCCRR